MIEHTTKSGKVFTLGKESYDECAERLRRTVLEGEAVGRYISAGHKNIVLVLRGHPLAMAEISKNHITNGYAADSRVPVDMLEIVALDPEDSKKFLGTPVDLAKRKTADIRSWVIPKEVLRPEWRSYEVIRDRCGSMGEAVEVFNEVSAKKHSKTKVAPTP